MLKIEYLNWDTSFFGFVVGRMVVEKNFRNTGKLEQVLSGFSGTLLYCFDRSICPKVTDLLLHFGFYQYDTKVIYRKNVKSMNYYDTQNIVKHNNSICKELEKLAYESGIYSRFLKDPNLKPYYKKLYKTWIIKSLTGEIADVVFVSTQKDLINGFVTLKQSNQTGKIGLIAVSANFRGNGIGSKLINACEGWLALNNCTSIEVETQLSNSAACNLYERNGFVIYDKVKIYHYWKK